MSYSEWLTRRTREAPKYLDTRPRGDASQFTETVKRQATVVRGRGTASDFVGYNAGAAYSEGTAANTKGPQIEIGPVSPPSSGEYGILTGFDENNRLYYPSFPVSGDFTVELFFKTSNTSNYEAVWGLIINGTDNIEIAIDSNNISFGRQPLETISIFEGVQANTWYHVAVSRSDGTWYTSVNGVTTGRGSQTKDLSGAYLVIGDERQNGSDPFYSGSISNFRVSNTALYTTPTYTIPTAPLSSEGARLLLLATQSNPFGDSAGTNVAVGSCTREAGPIVGPVFFPYGILSNIDASEDINLSAEFTIEFFAKLESGDKISVISINDEVKYLDLTRIQGEISIATSEFVPFPTGPFYYHYAICGKAGQVALYINGARATSKVPIDINQNSTLYIGNSDFADPITNFRFTNNQALYDDVYQIPSLPLSGGAILLLGREYALPILETSDVPNTVDGTATFSKELITVAPPLPFQLYGILTGFSGTNVLVYPSFTLGDTYTVELFFKCPSASASQRGLWAIKVPSALFSSDFLALTIQNSNLIVIIREGVQETSYTIGTVTFNAWSHVALTRSGTSWYSSINGTTTTETIGEYPDLTDTDMCIGDIQPLTTSPFTSGLISNFRVTSSALYTTNFTVPSLPLQSSQTTEILLLAKTQSTLGVDSSSVERTTSRTCSWQAGPISL